ncbi:hypothetical protein [Meiothermus sp.]|uniref:hypothetical protein n=1 Tax=Meiothermus sp. TaxID=1955249 RepID=UPI00307F0F89
MLLALDNFEHLLEAAPVVARLLEAAPELCILVTSRSTLRLRGEQEVVLVGLALPPSATAREALEQVPSVELFIRTAQAVRPGLERTPDNLRAIGEICSRLDGLVEAGAGLW